MTKQLHKLAREFQARLLAGGGPHRNQMDPVLRDGWATLFRWHEAGEKLWRIEDEEKPELADDLPLASAAIFAPSVCYVGPTRGEWIVVARHAAGELITIHSDQIPYAYPEPMISYITIVDEVAAAGVLNLEEQPTWGDVYLTAGKKGVKWLQQDDVAVEEARLWRAMRHWYRPPAIVI